MILFIDTEFNGFNGELISMAIISMDGHEFYEALECKFPVSSWVIENVIPVLNKQAINKIDMQKKLQSFLRQFNAIHVIADWPEDIKHFCDMILSGPGRRIDTPLLTLEIRRDLGTLCSEIPHNALEDAKALRNDYLIAENYDTNPT